MIQSNPATPSRRFVILAVFLAATCLYVATAQRTVSWQDSGEFQWRCLQGDLWGTMGLARAHPLYILAGMQLAKLSERHLPFLLNAFSGLGMAVALAALAATAMELTGRRCVGVLIAAMTAVAHAAWWLAVVAEVYTWSAAGLMVEVYLLVCLIRRPRGSLLAALALVSGLGLTIHNFALLSIPIIAVVAMVLCVKRRLSIISLIVAAGCWIVGAGLYVGMTVQLSEHVGLVEAIRSALLGDYQEQVFNVGGVSKHWKVNALLTALSFANFLLPLAVVGWLCFRRRLGDLLAGALGALTLLHVVFFVRYPVPDQFTFVLPSLLLVATAASVGLGVLFDAGPRWRLAAAGLCLLSIGILAPAYAAGAAMASKVNGPLTQTRHPFRDEARYWLIPWKHNERSAQQMARAELSAAPEGSVLLAPSTPIYPLRCYQALYGVGPTVQIRPGLKLVLAAPTPR